MFYAAVNRYATDTSVGFCNTWGVLGFATRVMRDAYVYRATDLATRPILSKDVRRYGGRLGHINHYDDKGHLWIQIDKYGAFVTGDSDIDPVTAARVFLE